MAKKSRKKSLTYKKALALASRLEWYLDQRNIEATVCGSVRRRRARVRDIDMVVLGPLRKTVHILEHLDGDKIDGIKMEVTMLSNRATMKRQADFIINGVQLNVYSATPEDHGAMVLFLTGSKRFNICVRSHAKSLGYKLNQYGLWLDEECIAGRFEEQLFHALGLHWMDPDQRDFEDGGELMIIERYGDEQAKSCSV